ncbi:PREDICTED: uncharacterized protein LOC109127732 [Camelina sativa]|uniref:Uncharacterized protein LOC109127732 n=1 Tax=Camelina sativa TaxID=90675 RepID=A0ABM1QPS2_CAMSA|nr:PREDICTED: uncharacterized protein LOC109127732 [Camelina sativa]
MSSFLSSSATAFFLLLCLCHVSSSKQGTYIARIAQCQMPSSFDLHSNWYHSSLRSISDSTELLYTYENAIHGFSTRLTQAEADSLMAQRGVISVLPEHRCERHTTRTPLFLGLDKDHRYELHTASHCNRKLIGARFLARGYESTMGPIDESKDSRSPRDDDGHGTHTSSTAAISVVEGDSLLGYDSGTARGMVPPAPTHLLLLISFVIFVSSLYSERETQHTNSNMSSAIECSVCVSEFDDNESCPSSRSFVEGVKSKAEEVAISILDVVTGEDQSLEGTGTIEQSCELRVSCTSYGIVTKIQKFDKALGNIKGDLIEPRRILLVAIVSIVVSFICAALLAPGRGSVTWSWIIMVTLFAFFLKLYLAGLVHGVATRWRIHIPGVRPYAYAFTVVKSILQIGVLLGFTYLDSYLKSRNVVLMVVAVVCLYIHLVCVYVAFRIGEDCDVINAFLSTSFVLLFELAKENGEFIIWLTISAIGLLFIKNLLLLTTTPADGEDADDGHQNRGDITRETDDQDQVNEAERNDITEAVPV